MTMRLDEFPDTLPDRMLDKPHADILPELVGRDLRAQWSEAERLVLLKTALEGALEHAKALAKTLNRKDFDSGVLEYVKDAEYSFSYIYSQVTGTPWKYPFEEA